MPDPVEVASLIASQQANADSFNRFITNFKKCSKANMTAGYLKGRLEGLNRLWHNYEQLHHQLVVNVSATECKSLPYFVEDHYSIYEEKYYDLFGVISDNLVPNSANPSITTSDTQPCRTSLPPIALPTFSGMYSEWQTFSDMFTSLVGNNTMLTGVQKLHYLKNSIASEADQLLRSYSLIEDNFEPAWKALYKRYNNRRLLINAQLNVLLSTAPINKETASSIRTLYDATNECLTALSSLKVETNNWGLVIIHIQAQRLPSETRNMWEQKLSVTTEPPTLEEFLTFLESRFRMLEAVNPTCNIVKRNVQSHYSTASNSSVACSYCKQPHSIRKCSQFNALPNDAKIHHVKTNHLCFNCLAPDHGSKTCPSKHGCLHCGRRHHSLLHNTNQHTHSPYNANSNTISALHASSQCKVVLLSTALIKVHVNERSHILRALIDTGSQASFITTTAFQRLRLKSAPTVATVSGLGGISTGTSHKSAELCIGSRFNDVILTKIQAIVLSSLTRHLPSTPINLPIYPHLANLQLADPNYTVPGAIDILLGSDVYPSILLEGLRTGPTNTPLAQHTKLGWILLGPLVQPSRHIQSTCVYFSRVDLESQLRRFWEIEDMNCVNTISEDQVHCENHFRETHERDAQGRYIVALPFKKPASTLGESFPRAMSQFMSVERRLKRDPTLNDAYTKCLEEYLTLNHMELIPDHQISSSSCYYLPHHAVVKASSFSTKLRVVFNASSPTDRDVSLNDILHTGPSLHQDLTAIITRWRFHRIAVSADMVKMYRQIRVRDSDCDFQRILWRKDQKQPVRHYRLKTV